MNDFFDKKSLDLNHLCFTACVKYFFIKGTQNIQAAVI